MMPLKKLLTIRSQAHLAKILQSSRPVVIKFEADWCPPCHAIAPLVLEVANETRRQVRWFRVSVDSAVGKVLSRDHRVRTIPTLIRFSGGVEKKRMTGAGGLQAIRALVSG